nr:EOG090X069C [Polyphemus pediculus]
MRSKSTSDRRESMKNYSEVMDYTELTERLRKTLYYGMIPKTDCSSLSLTRVIVEKFGENDDLFLERLCFDYAADLSREACLSPCSLVLALIYLERLCKKNPNFVSSIPSSKLFVISVMVASKFLNDEGEDDEVFNSDWAVSSKIDLKELNQLEKEFLTAIEWSLFVDEEDFTETLSQVESRIARQEGLKRGWLTYTDIDILARHKLMLDTWELVVNRVINVSITCFAAYIASLATLVGSALVATQLPWNIMTPPNALGLPINPISGLSTTHMNGLNHPISENGDPNDLESELDEIMTNITDIDQIDLDFYHSDRVNSLGLLSQFNYPEQWNNDHKLPQYNWKIEYPPKENGTLLFNHSVPRPLTRMKSLLSDRKFYFNRNVHSSFITA